MDCSYLLVNFGGPRDLEEIYPFLKELLCDRDVVRTKFPTFLHNALFKRIAYKRSLKIQHDYAKIGGGSPIFFDTEFLAEKLSSLIASPVLTFHRYLPATHEQTLINIENIATSEIKVLPLFPQFTYATTGSIARFFSKNLSKNAQSKLRWISSYPTHVAFIESFQRKIQSFLSAKNLKSQDSLLLFSAHGIPQDFIDTGDPYQKECEHSFQAIMNAFPQALGKLSYQSKFGKNEWIKPYTEEISKEILKHNQGRKNIIFIPLSFTSDHIETLFEVEEQYMPLIRNNHLDVYRCPALNYEPYWIDALASLFQEKNIMHTENSKLIRPLV